MDDKYDKCGLLEFVCSVLKVYRVHLLRRKCACVCLRYGPRERVRGRKQTLAACTSRICVSTKKSLLSRYKKDFCEPGMNPFMWYKNLIDLQPAYYRVDNAMLWRNFKVFQAHSMICPELKALFEGFGQCKVKRDCVSIRSYSCDSSE